MFNQLLASKKLTKTAINEALRKMKKAGIEKAELEAFLREMINGKQKSWLAHCTDAEALCIDRVISEVLAEHPGLICILRQRYEGRGMTKRKMAELLNDAHPGNDSNLLIVFYVQIMPDDFVMQLHRF